jgi:hypothetical protein
LASGNPNWYSHGKILGGDMIGEIALAIEMGADAVDIGKPFTRIQPLAKASAWRRRWRMGAARICRLRANERKSSLKALLLL